ncbi:MAG: hypothetical protein ABWY78_18110 [Microvirga sp.]
MPRKAVQGGAGERVPLNMMTTRDVRAKLEAAAIASGRSIAHEVVYHVELSLDWQLTKQTAHQQLGWVEDLVSEKGLAAIRQAGFDIVSTSDGERVLVDPKQLLGVATTIMDGRGAKLPTHSIEWMIEAAVEKGLARALGGRETRPDPDARCVDVTRTAQDEAATTVDAGPIVGDRPAAADRSGPDGSVIGMRRMLAADGEVRRRPADEGIETEADPAHDDNTTDPVPRPAEAGPGPAARRKSPRNGSNSG